MKILVIDDDLGRQEDFKATFDQVYPDWEVTYVYTSAEALEAFTKHTFDLAFFDHDLGWDHHNGSSIAYQVLDDPEKYHAPKSVWIHSNNSVGCRNIHAKFASVGIPTEIYAFDHTLIYKIKDRDEFEPYIAGLRASR